LIRKILNHSFIYAVLPKLPILLGFVILPLITPYLTDVDYGVYGIVLSIVTGITVIKTLGLDIILMNTFIHHGHSKRYKIVWNEIQGFIFIWSFVLGLLVNILLYFILPIEAETNKYLIILLTAIPIMFYSSLQVVSLKYYQLAEKPMAIGVRSLIFGVLTIFLNYYFIVYLKIGYMGWVWSMFITETLTFLSFIYPLWIKNKLYPNFLFRRNTMKKHLKIGLPLVPHTSAFFLLDFSDRLVMLKMGVSTANIGLYDFAYKFAGYARVFSESIHQASTPLLIKSFKKDGESNFLRDIIFLENYIVAFVSFTIAIWLKEIFSIMVNNEELNSTYNMGINLTMAYVYKPMYTAMATVFYYYEKTKEFWKISFTAGVVNIVLNIIFIPIYGFKAAVFTTFLAFLFIGYAGFYVTQFKKLYSPNFHPLLWVGYTILLLFSSYFFRDAEFLIKFALTVIVLIFTGLKALPLIKKLK
jgi:O-antigen/teichoic acid export membrane protein